ncbi:MAG: T9SS type A sorting domain-containing protein [Bacteroidia bacterium]|nr:T9SS type A sorting domain-containing protein [Bacteroidia bacterium]MCF8446741.1 T9SS type A sorting domain-containing protein [Bacteroidia bacterium]
MKKISTLILSILSLTSFSQTYLVENFNYTNDSLAAVGANNGWLIASGATTNALRANASALTYTGYIGSGLGNAVPMTTSGQDVYKDISLAGGVTTGSVYASFMAKVTAATATGDYFFALLPPTSTSTFTARTYIYLSSTGYYKMAINRNTEARAISADSFALGSTNLFVVRYDFNASGTGDDSIYLYVIPSGMPSTRPATPTAFCSNATSGGAAAVGRVVLRQGSTSSAPTLQVGGIRLGLNWTDGPLPVKLTSFTGAIENHNANLKWTTSSESDNKGFEIERSLNGLDFESVGFVKGAGNSSKITNYEFIDSKIPVSTLYYRLNQIDLDGKSTYSNVITLKQDEFNITVLPNPFTDQLTINSGAGNQTITVEVIDMTGKVKLNTTTIGNVHLDTKVLAEGVYFVKVTQGEKVIVKRIIKR